MKAGSQILYFGDDDLSLPQFRPGGNEVAIPKIVQNVLETAKNEMIFFWNNTAFREKVNASWYINSDICWNNIACNDNMETRNNKEKVIPSRRKSTEKILDFGRFISFLLNLKWFPHYSSVIDVFICFVEFWQVLLWWIFITFKLF